MNGSGYSNLYCFSEEIDTSSVKVLVDQEVWSVQLETEITHVITTADQFNTFRVTGIKLKKKTKKKIIDTSLTDSLLIPGGSWSVPVCESLEIRDLLSLAVGWDLTQKPLSMRFKE